MDEIVKAALLKWPNVPHCHGWLGLDARGDWYLRDDATQAAGPFPRSRGSRIEHDGLLAFIARNYDVDGSGAWFFQNGPQRVYVDLEAAPRVLRVDDAPGWALRAHTGGTARAGDTWLDEHGRLFVDTDIGLGIVHTLDVEIASRAIDAGDWREPVEIAFDAMPARFGYRLQPRPAAG